MDNLFYSPKERILFNVAGYTDNSEDVEEIIKMLNRERDNLAALIPEKEKSKIKTFMVNESRRYKHMRVFYVETTTVPDEAFLIGKKYDWTMNKWVHD